ncbi:high mobility group protein B3-like [Rattus rattus]|uniref:high mobility group protein B3-like n=1 Tax=Rattus rattus TaxID=10117 RepID=UPI0013F384CD|nr:high mobility group protein B3-like [Rattus rattus]
MSAEEGIKADVLPFGFLESSLATLTVLFTSLSSSGHGTWLSALQSCASYLHEMKDYGPVKGGKKKDLNAPKRTLSGFFLFCSKFCPKIKSTNCSISFGDVVKKLGEMWNNLSHSEKPAYITKSAKLRAKYEKDAANYKSEGKFDDAKGPANAAQKKVEAEEEEK